MIYFARMLDKIRKQHASELRDDFHSNLGKGFDAKCVNFLRVEYAALKERVLAGGSDEEILRWCFAKGRELSTEDIFIWNEFMKKVGWNDFASGSLAKRKLEAGLERRDDILTMLEYFEVDEGRKP
jgi:gluconokinase